jgi:hypothetical protein
MHAQSGYTYKDLAIAVTISTLEEGRLWLNAEHSYQLRFSERDQLLKLVRSAARRIEIANAHKTTISYRMDLGSFRTEEGGAFFVSFQTDGYAQSFTIVTIMDDGNYDLLWLNMKDTNDFINVLENAHSIIDDYQKQADLFKEVSAISSR